ncbi:MAG: hypothetical protein IK115_01135, partial [Lachnospiraceae bacterium]|nr:hypothetical protein [Lachnospiraceae bacterium]
NDYGTGIGGGNRSRGGTIRILGGQVTVSVSRNNYSGIGAGYAFPSEETHSSDHSNDVEADILLGCSKQNDFILSAYYRGNNVWIADNQILQDGEGVKLSGAVTELSTISGNKLTLSHAHSFTYSRNGGTVTATCDDPACPFHVTPAIVSLSAPAGNLTYDGTTKAATLTDESGICGTESVLYQKRNSDDSWGEAAAEAPKNAGSYRAGITLADTGHGAVSVYVEYEIAQRPVTITDLTPPGRSYDGTTIADVIRPYATLTGKVEGDELDFVMGSSNFVDAAPGQNKSIICSGYYLSGAASANYILSSQPSDLKGTINQRAITIKAKDQTIELNGFIKNDLSEVEIEQGDSLVAGEELKSVTLTPYPEVADHVTNNGEYGTITPGSARIMRGDKDVTGYYRITYTQGNLTITRTRAKVLTEPTARTNLRYSGQESLQQLINPGTADTYMQYAVRYVSYGDGSPVEGVDGSTSPRDYSSGQDAYKAWKAGTYHVWYRAAADTDHEESVAKYVTVNIARVPLTIGLEPETITYGENPADSGRQHQYTYTGVVGGDSGSLGSGSVSFSECSWDVGSYPLRVYGFSSNNYDITFAPGILTIVPKEVSLDWSATPLTFNGRAQAPTVSAGSLSGNDAITVTVSGNRINAGSGYTATAVALTGDKAGNYRLPSDNTKTFSIAKAAAPAVTDISLELPAGTLSFNASAAGKMPPNAGTLSFNKGSESPIAYVTDWSVDSTTGLVSANISGGTAGDTITLPVTVSSENYENVEINVKVKLVDKSDAGIAITQGSALTTDYDINTSPTLQATVSYQGTGSATWSWESSDTSVATVASVVGNSTECTVTIKGAGTTCITAKYNSDTTAGSAVLNLTVRPGSVAIPEAVDSLSYNGSEQTGVAAGARYTVTGEKGTQPGSYTAVASLTDTLNYRWADGSAEPKYISWSIDKTAGPAAPEGLQAVPPTTGDNLDGKIRGVTADMEFASGISFNDAVPCFGNEIPGLIPGTWYVRIRETATRKPGEAAEVLIPKCTPPLVSAVQGLSYNG